MTEIDPKQNNEISDDSPLEEKAALSSSEENSSEVSSDELKKESQTESSDVSQDSSQKEQEQGTPAEQSPQQPAQSYQQPYQPYGGQPPYAGGPAYGQVPPPQYGEYPSQNGATPPPYGYYTHQYQRAKPYQPQPGQPSGGGRKMGPGQKKFFGVLITVAVVLVVCLVAYAAWSSLCENKVLPKSPTVSSIPKKDKGYAKTPEDKVPPASMPNPNLSAPAVKAPEKPLIPGKTITIHPVPSTAPLSADKVYEKVAPSVVGIISVMPDGNNLMGGPQKQGSGIIATEDGFIITNSHVVNNSRKAQVTVVTRDQKRYRGVVSGFDKTTDLAVIKINAKGLTPAEFGNIDDMKVGNEVYPIGNPGGLAYASSMTQGIISALNRRLGSNSDNGMTYIQTDAAINPGNSGGALANAYGQVIGINSVKLVATDVEGMGFAIPVSRAKTILSDLMSEGYVKGRVRLGIKGRDVTPQEAVAYGVPQGFIILEIDRDSSVGRAGARPRDIIYRVDGKETTDLAQINSAFLNKKPGEKIKLTIYRMPELGETKGKSFDITVTLLADKGQTQK